MLKLLPLTVADYLIVAGIALSVLISVSRGFLKECISLGVWLFGAWVAIKFHLIGAKLLVPYVQSLSVRIILSFLGIFFLVWLLGAIFNHLLGALLTKTGLSGFDRLFGMVFGLARGILLIAVILLLISTTSFVEDHWWQHSVLIPYFKVLTDWLQLFLPAKLAGLMHQIVN